MLFFFGTTDVFQPKNITTTTNVSFTKNTSLPSLEDSSKLNNTEVAIRNYEINQKNIQESVKEEVNLTEKPNPINQNPVQNVSNPNINNQEINDEYEQMMDEYYSYREENPRVPE